MNQASIKARKKRHLRVRAKVRGTNSRPRLSVFRSKKQIYAQIINDDRGKTLVSATSLEPDIRKKIAKKTGMEIAVELGRILAQRAQEKHIDRVVFDRSGYKYHGRVKALAEGVRAGGLQF